MEQEPSQNNRGEVNQSGQTVNGDQFNIVGPVVISAQNLPRVRWFLGIVLIVLIVLLFIITLIWFNNRSQMEMTAKLIEDAQSEQETNIRDGIFTIAVAKFSTTNFGSNSSDIGEQIADRAYSQLQTYLEQQEPGFFTVVKPKDVGEINASEQNQREAMAAELAEKLGAQVVVYGVVDGSDDIWNVKPEFYIAPEYFYSDASEFIGTHELGAPFPMVGKGDERTRVTIFDEVALRMKLLTHIAVGLTYYAAPTPNKSNYQKALVNFEEIEKDEKLWQGIANKYLIHLLIGNAQGKLGNTDAAIAEFQEALAQNPEYARAYIGLGGAYYSAAFITDTVANSGAIRFEMIENAITEYQNALSAKEYSSVADIDVKVHYGLGQCYLALGLYQNKSAADLSWIEFSTVIEQYNKTRNLRIKGLAAESHARRGLLLRTAGENQKAADEYRSAIDLSSDDPKRRSVFQDALNKLKIDNG